MKKRLLSVLLVLALLLSVLAMTAVTASAEEGVDELTVCDGEDVFWRAPFYGMSVPWKQLTQMLYNADMLKTLEGKKITSLSYYPETPTATTWGATWTIKMFETNATTTTKEQLDNSKATIVYTGEIDSTTEVITITLDTPYTYQGSNLVIEFSKDEGGEEGIIATYGIYATENAIYCYNYTPIDKEEVKVADTFLPKVTFGYEEALTGDAAAFATFKADEVKRLEALSYEGADFKADIAAVKAVAYDAAKSLEANKAAVYAAETVRKSYEPMMVDGNNQTIDLSKVKTASFRSDAPMAEFKQVLVDGTVVDAANYTVTEGSTIITLNEAYLKSLKSGNHEITIESLHGKVAAPFAVTTKAASDVVIPRTGAESNVAFYAIILAVSALAVAVLAWRKKVMA